MTGPKRRGEMGLQGRGLRSRSYFRKGSLIREKEVGGRREEENVYRCTGCERVIHKREHKWPASMHEDAKLCR